MKNKPDLQTVLHKGIAFLSTAQRADGHFESITTSKKDTRGIIRNTTFHTSLILKALSLLHENRGVKEIARRGVKFLLSEQSSERSFNYWKKKSFEYASIHCPDDLDDTGAAFSAINAWKPDQIDEAALLAFARHLILAEIKAGGPYNTWLIAGYKKTPWEDTDVAVQANIMDFLASKNIFLPRTTAYIEKELRKKKITSKYYPPLAILYLVSRWYKGTLPLIRTLARYKPRKSDSLAIALYISAFLCLGGKTVDIRASVSVLLKQQHKDGSWEAAPFFIEQIKEGAPQWSGSRALTTAHALEAIALYGQKKQEKAREEQCAQIKKRAQAIAVIAQKRFSARSSRIQKTIRNLIAEIDKKDPTCEITLLPYFFSQNMRYPEPDMQAVDELCVMNLLGWIGYTIYDKILDGEDTISLLPVANICIREVASIAARWLPAGQKKVKEIFSTIDETNFWEHRACRLSRNAKGFLLPKPLPDYKDGRRLAEKSIGHMLGPLILLLRQTGSVQKRERQAANLSAYFTDYLAARQLNDDAHDWLEDLRNGFINGASIHLFSARHKKSISKIIILEKEEEKLKKLFWKEIIDTVSRDILAHARKARGALASMKYLKDTAFLEAPLFPLERSAQAAIAERDSAKKMLSLYKH